MRERIDPPNLPVDIYDNVRRITSCNSEYALAWKPSPEGVKPRCRTRCEQRRRCDAPRISMHMVSHTRSFSSRIMNKPTSLIACDRHQGGGPGFCLAAGQPGIFYEHVDRHHLPHLVTSEEMLFRQDQGALVRLYRCFMQCMYTKDYYSGRGEGHSQRIEATVAAARVFILTGHAEWVMVDTY